MHSTPVPTAAETVCTPTEPRQLGHREAQALPSHRAVKAEPTPAKASVCAWLLKWGTCELTENKALEQKQAKFGRLSAALRFALSAETADYAAYSGGADARSSAAFPSTPWS